MKMFRLVVFVLVVSFLAEAQQSPVTLRAGTLLDGKGGVLHNVTIVVQDGKITRVDANAKAQPSPGSAFYDLGRATVLPGWIDLHDHVIWHFGPNGRFEDKSETPSQAALAAAGNAYATLMAGFTTIQSVGSPEDKELRAAIGWRLARAKAADFTGADRRSQAYAGANPGGCEKAQGEWR